jgi:hypothetical protein
MKIIRKQELHSINMKRQQLITFFLMIRLKTRENSGMVGICLLKIMLSPGLLSLKL